MAVDASPGAGRVLIALSDGPLVAEPTWTRYDELTTARCYGVDCTAGRSSELDTTDTGTARVFFHDRNKSLDDDDLVGCQIMLQLFNPVTETWHPRWRGHIDDVDRTLVDADPSIPLADTVVTCVDVFDYLGGCKMQAGVFGDTGGPPDVVFYEDERVDDRCIALLDDALIASTMRIVFTGNIFVNETLYDTDDSILTALRDAADAEFPGVANVYVDRFGRACFHGRHARFDPEATAATASGWDFVRYSAATREDVVADVAQIREFGYNKPRARLINTYVAYPRADELGVAFDRADIPGLQRTKPSSITKYGYRGGRDAPDLIVQKEYPASGGRTGAELCGLFGDFYIDNYSAIRRAVQRVAFKTHRPDDDRAAATWELMCNADVADALQLTIDEADLANEAFFIDGLSVECRPMAPDLDFVTFTPNLTPGSYYGEDVFDA